MRRLVPFILPVVVVLLSIGLLSVAQRSGRLPRIAAIDWRARRDPNRAEIPQEA